MYGVVEVSTTGIGNINSDPKFKSTGVTVDLHLTPDSPCIDTTGDYYAPTTDKDGKQRVDISGKGNGGVTADMGADEYQP